ncbi:hypothetical protein [Thermococcus sp.]
MEWALLLLIAGFLSLLSFLLDLKAEENLRETLKDLFMGLTFIAWYWDRDILGALFAVEKGGLETAVFLFDLF